MEDDESMEKKKLLDQNKLILDALVQTGMKKTLWILALLLGTCMAQDDSQAADIVMTMVLFTQSMKTKCGLRLLRLKGASLFF